MKRRIVLDNGWKLFGSMRNGGKAALDIAGMPAGVHEILYAHGLIGDGFLIGEGEDLKWVAEKDWTYLCRFDAPDIGAGKAYLNFKTLYTVVSIRLNGEEISVWKDLYLPLRVDVTDKLKEKNTLELAFQSPYAYMRDNPLPDAWQGKMAKWRVMRKPIHDFDNYLGAQPYLTLMGIFGETVLEIADASELTQTGVETLLEDGCQTGIAVVCLSASNPAGCYARISVKDPDGLCVCDDKVYLDGDGHPVKRRLSVENPRLWWPRGYGDHPLYGIDIELYGASGDVLFDQKSYAVGFRDIVTDINFNLLVNNVKVRMWGANLSPIDGKTHRWNPERANVLIDLFTMANMNAMRIWGEGEPYGDELYEECDRRGILVWQEFYGSYGMLPDWPAYQELCVKEAEDMISRLKHHPSIFMWCGGNEVIMGGEYDHPGERVIGLELYTKLLPEVCARLDPGRYYHITSPYGGAFANDPREGDSHGYEMWWYVPGMEYPVAFTEHMRVSGPALKSVKRWIDAGSLWDDGFVDATYPWKRQKDLMPKAWFHRVGNSLDTKAGPVHEFRDADSPAELAYKYAAAHAKSFKNGIKRSRMGRPSYSEKPRISNMHLIWKFADTFPLIYSAIVDYYAEPYIPYYEAKRSYEPVMCCFDIRDSITIWLVNDGIRDVSGVLEYGLFTPGTNTFLELRKIDASMRAGLSGEVVSLDGFGQFRTENILYARFIDRTNNIDYQNYDYVEIERRLMFPEAKLKLSASTNGDGLLYIESDSFARCVELSASDGGDEFGFYFSDNYFDLIPGIKKIITIEGRRKKGLIKAKAHYSPYISSLEWNRI